ncbi:MAG: glycosyl hydrolase family 18 protein [bacterium]
MKKSFFFFILFLTLTTAANAFESIHEIELKKYKSITPPLIYGIPSKKLLSETALHKPLTDNLVFGYLTYWSNSTEHLKYGLLTDLLYFSCELSDNGNLGNCHGWPNSAPIDEAHRYGVRVHLVITGFDGAVVQSLMESTSQKNIFFENCWNKVNNAKADGINIDFEAFGSVKKADLISFFNDLGEYFHSRNHEMAVSAALPAVDWSDRWDIASMDGLDYAFLMLYDYHWKSGDPGPVAPLISKSPWAENGICVEKSLNTYISKNGDKVKDKLIAGYPYYGIKWKTANDKFPATKIENGVAVLFDSIMSGYLTKSGGWDDGSETPYKIWKEGSQWYQLWYDDQKSIDAKYLHTKQLNIAGVGMWALNYDTKTDELWETIAKNFVKEKAGSFENPVKINSFPFEHSDNTYRFTSNTRSSYDCIQNISDTTTIDMSGPEIVFQFETDCSGTLVAEITEGYGEKSQRENIDIHLLAGEKGETCVFRNDALIKVELEKGVYYIVADSRIENGITKGGPFSISVNFLCDEQELENDDDLQGDDEAADKEETYSDEESFEHESSDADSEEKDEFVKEELPDDDLESEVESSTKKGGCSVNAL